MIFRFNTAQLERVQRESLQKILAVLQVENENEIDISVVEFPKKFSVKVDKGFMILVWNDEKQFYDGLTEPTPESDHGTETVDLPGPESLTETKPEPELDLSPVLERSQALARVLANLTKPLENDHRFIVWTDFLITLLKELEK